MIGCDMLVRGMGHVWEIRVYREVGWKELKMANSVRILFAGSKHWYFASQKRQLECLVPVARSRGGFRPKVVSSSCLDFSFFLVDSILTPCRPGRI